jgi:hypothetical protein
MQLAELLDKTGLDVLDDLQRQVTVPVIDGLQAQGDLVVIPADMINTVRLDVAPRWRPVPPEGIELVRGVAGNNPHTLVADHGTCHFSRAFRDNLGLTIAVVENTAPAYLVHPEHGASDIAPGRWLVRRQQESTDGDRAMRVLIAD